MGIYQSSMFDAEFEKNKENSLRGEASQVHISVLINTKIRLTSKEKISSVWIEGGKLSRGGVSVGDVYYAVFDRENCRVVATTQPTSSTDVAKKFVVSKRERNGVVRPLIELRAEELAEIFGESAELRIAICRGRITIKAHYQTDKENERLLRFVHKIKSGEKLAVGSLFHGGGVLDRAVHEGLKLGGLDSSVRVAIEVNAKYLECSLQNNSMLWDENSIVIESPIEKVDFSQSPLLDVVLAGIPCTGASLSGRAKNNLSCAEQHEGAGSLFFYFLNFVLASQPAIVWLENVTPYQNTASFMVIKSVLESAGYNLSVRTVNGNEFGALENRNRLVCVATTKGLVLDIDTVLPIKTKEAALGDVLECLPADSSRWKEYDYLAVKAVKDKVAGKGFKRQLLNGNEPFCGTIGAGYSKARSTEPFLLSPFDAKKSRLFTKNEHAQVKTIPVSIVDGVSDRIAHEILGQSVIYAAFVALAKSIAKQLKDQVINQHTLVDGI